MISPPLFGMSAHVSLEGDPAGQGTMPPAGPAAENAAWAAVIPALDGAASTNPEIAQTSEPAARTLSLERVTRRRRMDGGVTRRPPLRSCEGADVCPGPR